MVYGTDGGIAPSGLVVLEDEPTSGVIKLDGADNRSLPGYELRRSIGYAIQGHGLFPHRTVAQNIATVPVLLGWDAGRIKRCRQM